MTRLLDFEKTPQEKADHMAAQFGTDSLYTQALKLVAKMVGENPTIEEVRDALILAERWVDYQLKVRHQS